MHTIISIVQIAIAVILIALVLIQDSGSGVGESFGGGGANFSHQRRGIERITHIATIIGLIIFALSSLALLLI